MQQKQLNLLKPLLITVLIVNISFGCKQKDNITPPPVITPNPLSLILIKAGIFKMGSPEMVGADNERPERTVKLDAFYLSPTELTRKEFKVFLQFKDTIYLPSHTDPTQNQRKIESYNSADFTETDNQPIINISWFGTVAYCNWLTKYKGNPQDTCYTFTFNTDGTIKTVTFDRTKKGYRLPTEAEWEYACRAGTTSLFSFGDDYVNLLKDYAWSSLNGVNQTHPVGLKKPNSWGLYDMHGNVWEWCWDWLPSNAPYYNTSETDNPTGPTMPTTRRIARGGSWYYNATYLRSAYRGAGTPISRDNSTSFRLAKTS